jgi:hypothetical protein
MESLHRSDIALAISMTKCSAQCGWSSTPACTPQQELDPIQAIN